jgi:predicted small metal-binding protein
MAKVVRCRDVGFNCEGVVRAETEEEVLKQVAAHAKAVHNLQTVSEEVVAKVRQVMRDSDGY